MADAGNTLFLFNAQSSAAHPAQPHFLDPSIFFEKPERLGVFVEVASQFSGENFHLEECNTSASREVLELVHPKSYLDAFEDRCRDAGVGRLEFGTEFFVSQGSFNAARAAVGCAILGTERLIDGAASHVVSGCRPPGHHAGVERSMGFCGLSTAALAAIYAQQYAVFRGQSNFKVCVFDYDAHSGNGTIEALIHRPKILFCETRTMTMDAFHTEVPYRAFPYPTGSNFDPALWYDYAPSGGNLVLLDLFLGITGDQYLQEVNQRIIPAIRSFAPDMLIISAGFDCMKGDPLGDLGLEPKHLEALVRSLIGIGPPTLTVLEGGYDVKNLKSGLAAHLRALTDRR